MKKRLLRGDEGKNPLDCACKIHDLAYESKDTNVRYLADKELQKVAMKRICAKDSSLGERATALGVAIAMKAKRTLTKRGKGMNNKNNKRKKARQIAFNTLLKHARLAIRKSKPNDVEEAVRAAVEAVNRSKHGKRVEKPRIIPIPARSGGALSVVPIFTGLSALGSIVGGTSGIINAINQYMLAKNQLIESKQENREIEAIAIGNHNKKGSGFYLNASTTGSGLFLSNSKNQ